MDFWTWTLVIVVCSALYYYFKKTLNYFEDRGIPYVPAWPILGNMAPVVFRRKHINDLLKDIYNANPEAKYIGAFDFLRPVIVLRDLDLIKRIGIKNFDEFPDHLAFIDDTVDPLFGRNLFNLSGDRWKETRNLLTPTFTSSKMKAMYTLIVECAQDFVSYLEKQPKSFLDMVATKDLFTKYTNDVVATCAFGIKVDTLNDPENKFYVLGREATRFDGVRALKFFVARAFPKLMKIFKMKFVDDYIAKFFENIVRTTVQTRDAKGITRPDMLQIMMDARGKEGKHLNIDVTEMTAHAFIFFFGGFDTSSNQMCIIAHELAINPDIQKKLQDEIDEIMKKTDGKPTYEAIASMLYLDAIFNESMRYHTQVSMLDRLCRAPFELPPALPGGKPFTLQPGMVVWVPAIGIHMDPKYYDEPEKFNPDRYYQKKVTINDVTNLGFGIGPRGCIGNRFAILETKVLLFFLLHKFNLKPNKKTAIPFKYSTSSFNVKPKEGFWLAIEPRS